MSKLSSGAKAPDFTLTGQDSRAVTLSDFRGGKVLLYFYPRADTPGCTKQACSIRDSADALQEAGVVPLGISPDVPDEQQAFDEKFGLGFRLLSDPDHAVAEGYGVWAEKTFYGKTTMGIVRSSFLIDEKGLVIEAWYRVRPEDTIPKAMKALCQ